MYEGLEHLLALIQQQPSKQKLLTQRYLSLISDLPVQDLIDQMFRLSERLLESHPVEATAILRRIYLLDPRLFQDKDHKLWSLAKSCFQKIGDKDRLAQIDQLWPDRTEQATQVLSRKEEIQATQVLSVASTEEENQATQVLSVASTKETLVEATKTVAVDTTDIQNEHSRTKRDEVVSLDLDLL
ncbi:MAG: hypothetical protein KA436_09470 [Oligoflexales bacterium]|nr:hypothetical protein [Oligoflexales bacterium]